MEALCRVAARVLHHGFDAARVFEEVRGEVVYLSGGWRAGVRCEDALVRPFPRRRRRRRRRARARGRSGRAALKLGDPARPSPGSLHTFHPHLAPNHNPQVLLGRVRFNLGPAVGRQRRFGRRSRCERGRIGPAAQPLADRPGEGAGDDQGEGCPQRFGLRGGYEFERVEHLGVRGRKMRKMKRPCVAGGESRAWAGVW